MSFLKIEDGLFNNWISCIAQDEKGFIWVGTQDGLHRYDGYSFEVFRNSAEDIHSLDANWTHDIVMAANDTYWIGTYGAGLVKFSPKTMTFENFEQEKARESLGTIAFQVVLADKNHVVSSTDDGFQIHNTHTDSVKSLGFGYYDSPIASDGAILWLAENENLVTYNLETEETNEVYSFSSRINFLELLPNGGILVGQDNKLVLFNQYEAVKEVPLNKIIVSLISDKKGNYIAATFNSLHKFNVDSLSLEPMNVDLDFSNQNIQTLFLDRQNSLWVGTDKGLFKEKKFNKAFSREGIDIHARRIVKHKGALYLGGNHGLFKVGHNNAPAHLIDSQIRALFDQGDMLIASSVNSTIYKFRNDTLYRAISNFSQHNQLMVHGLTRDQNKRLWAGSWDGLFVFDENDELLKSISLEDNLIEGDSKIVSIYLDSNDRLWIITAAYGIYMIEGVSDIDLDLVASKIIHFKSKKGEPHSLTSNIVMTLEEDQQGQMWFGTDLGVVKYQEDTGNFSRLHYQNKIFDKKVMALRKDAKRNLWISTINDGLYVYNEEEENIRHFTKNDGLISNAFLFGSGLFDKESNLMYFGTDEGVQKIDLSQPFNDKKDIAPLITAFHVNNGKGKTIISPSQAPFLDKVSLEASQNDFSIRFSAMDFIAPEKICYAYSLDEGPWKMTDLQTAYFTNVPYGNHVLNVKALHDGIATNRNVSGLDIYIKPPWYYSRLAKILYVLFVLASVWGVYRYLKWRWKMRFRLKMKEEEAARLQKLNDLKSQLYIDIAHEFKTPLTLIAGPIDSKLREGNISDQEHSNFSLVQRNANRLTSLVDQLLELAGLENGKLNLKVASGRLDLFLNILSYSFEYQAQLKQIQYLVDIEVFKEVWYDEDVVEKIVTNLLSNAFKYTPEKGSCWLMVKKVEDKIVISLKNTVLNGSELKLEKLFTRFYQNDSHAEGMGVGLALVKELVTLYGGSVNAELEGEDIIHFCLSLPYREDQFKVCDISKTDLSSTATKPPEHADLQTTPVDSEECDLPILLIVEDQAEIRAFVRQALQKQYKIVEAENGKMGIDLALDLMPDIILSDIRMPQASGIDLCNVLKTDERTSHIPIILLTGTSTEENELKGLDSGANDFVTKPFKIRILEKRIANLINQRKMLRARYSKELILKPREIAITPADESFLNRIQEILDEHLYDPSFNSTVFSEKANMSRMQLHRKLQAYTGLSTSAFIRSQRLKQAIHILETSEVTINEVAYLTGFNSPSYFMTCFKETFKKTPSEYLQSLQD